jgi:hypothetical protein
MSVPVVQCRATSRTGKQCKNKAIPGGAVCRFHGGASPHVASKAAVRAEVMAWGLHDETVDPGETLLRLVTQSSARAQRYALELEQMVAETDDDLRKALIHTGPFGESVRAMVKLENEERDRCSTFAAKAIAAGIAERQVRIAEQQAVILAGVVRAVLDRLELSEEQQALAPIVLREELMTVSG